MARPKRRKLSQFSKWKKKAPRVPDITCPIIDDVLLRLDKHYEQHRLFSKHQWNIIHKRMEQLRTDNELLREGGQFWYEICKEHLKTPKK